MSVDLINKKNLKLLNKIYKDDKKTIKYIIKGIYSRESGYLKINQFEAAGIVIKKKKGREKRLSITDKGKKILVKLNYLNSFFA